MSPTPITSKRILVVDDNLNAAQTLSLLLRKLWGHTVEIAYDGIAALEKVGEFKPEIILLDIGLPGLSGYQVAQQIRANPELSGIRLIALSGYGEEQDVLRSREVGFDNYLVKPVSVAALQTALEQLV
jgi:CheY-like chemotaxis protein